MARLGMNRRMLAVGAAAAVVCLAALTGTSVRGDAATWEPKTRGERAVLAHVRAVAVDSTVGADRGLASDGWPTGVQRVRFVATTRDRALVAVGAPDAVVGDRRPVWLFEMKGRFSVPILAPAGYAKTAQGSYRLIVMDPSTGEPLGGGVGDIPALMAGDVVTLVDRG
jgi:hypothetical protein